MEERDEGPTPDRPSITPHAYANVARASASSSEGRSPDTTRRIDRFRFELALGFLRDGHRVARTGWNGPSQFIKMQGLNINMSEMPLPYLFIHTARGETVPWLPSPTDLLASDWCLVTERTVLVYGNDDLHRGPERGAGPVSGG